MDLGWRYLLINHVEILSSQLYMGVKFKGEVWTEDIHLEDIGVGTDMVTGRDRRAFLRLI